MERGAEESVRSVLENMKYGGNPPNTLWWSGWEGNAELQDQGEQLYCCQKWKHVYCSPFDMPGTPTCVQRHMDYQTEKNKMRKCYALPVGRELEDDPCYEVVTWRCPRATLQN